MEAANGEASAANKDLLQSLLASDSPKGGNGKASEAHGDPPDPEDLIVALQELENAASSELAVREQIAKLPAEVSEASHLDELKSTEEGQKLLSKVRYYSGLY